MKYHLLLLALLLPGLGLLAQGYQPFLPKKLHYLTDGTQNYSLRTDSAGVIGSDSAFWMTPLALLPAGPCNNPIGDPQFILDQEGYFGDHFLRYGDGSYRFVSRAGDTATFHTRLPIGQSWSFRSSTALTAQIVQATTTLIDGNLDSMIVIDVSDGNQYALSKQHGIYAGPNLDHYFSASPIMNFTMIEPPQVPDFKQFFAWQPGDVFFTRFQNGPFDAYNSRWVTLTRQENLAGDTLVFKFSKVTELFVTNNPYLYFPLVYDTLVLSRAEMAYLESATYEFDSTLAGYHYHVQQPWHYDTTFHMRKTLPFRHASNIGFFTPCGYVEYNPATCYLDEAYTIDLGKTYDERVNGISTTMCYESQYYLECYEQAGTDSLGPCPAYYDILPVTKPLAERSMRLQRNSQSGEISVRWDAFVVGEYHWQLYDLQGRLLQDAWVQMDAQGLRTIAPVGATGMYLLRVTEAAGAWGQTLRVPVLR